MERHERRSPAAGVLTGGDVWCWGQNNKGQIGDGTTTDRNKPVEVLSGVADITAGADYTCAVMKTGHVLCWGNNENGQLADGTKTSHTLPSPAQLITGVSGLDGGQNRTCGLNGAGLITCWSGGGAAQTLSPVIPVTGGAPEANDLVAVNRFGSLIVGVDEQGMPITFQSGKFSAVSTLNGVLYVDSGAGQICALLGDATVKCWGANNYGQLGDSTTVNSAKPVGVIDLSGASDLAVGRNHACVIIEATQQSTLIKCWGLNDHGQLGAVGLAGGEVAERHRVFFSCARCSAATMTASGAGRPVQSAGATLSRASWGCRKLMNSGGFRGA